MRLLVFGGRDFTDRDFVFACLDRVHAKRPVSVLIEGDADGADKLAGEWADSRGVHCARVRALWEVHGRSAGPLRNKAMRDLDPDYAVAFPGGRGTAHMTRLMDMAGVVVWEPKP